MPQSLTRVNLLEMKMWDEKDACLLNILNWFALFKNSTNVALHLVAVHIYTLI